MVERKDQQTKLGFTRGSSDKTYIVHLEQTGNDLWKVYAWYGRRWNANNFTPITETSGVAYSDAIEAYHKTIAKKKKKGYEIEY